MSAVQRLIPLDSPAEWTAALEGIPHAFGHTWECCHALYLTARLPTYLYCFQQEEVRIVCPIWEREYRGTTDIVTPYGFSGFTGAHECPAFPAHWTEFARACGYVCGYLGAHPLLWRESYARSNEIFQDNHLYVLDLSLSAEELLSRMAKGRRHQLRSWTRGAARLWDDQASLTDFFIRHHQRFLAARNASRAAFLSAETIRALATSESVFLLGAGAGDEIQAVILVAYSPVGGEALALVSLPQGQQHSAPLFWHAALRLQSLGVRLMSLGGGVRENDGIARFKRLFGAASRPLKALKQVYDPACFGVLCREAGLNPTDRSGYFPPYRAP